MFLVVFVTLVISIIGLYAQVLSIQSTRIYNSQKGLMDTMLTWHTNAVAKAKPFILSNTFDFLPCQLTTIGTVGTANIPYPNCKSGGVDEVMTAADLPPNYKIPYYSFYSVVFQSPTSGINYVATYALYTDSNGNLELPDSSGFTTGYTLGSLMNQFANNAPFNVTYGYVTTDPVTGEQKLNVSSKTIGAPTLPPLPYVVAPSIPSNALAVISVAS